MQAIVNKSARFHYEITDTFEAGLVLEGWEVKSLKERRASIKEAYITHENGELWLIQCHIQLYTRGDTTKQNTTRKRKILLRKREMERLINALQVKRMTLVPLRIYTTRGILKIQIGLAKGRKKHEKRQVLKERSMQKEAKRVMDALHRG